MRLRAHGVEGLRAAIADEQGVRRYIYDGLLSREQAAQGAAIGQYVRIAQSAARSETEQRFQPQPATVETAFMRRDLMDSMFQQMTGEAPGWPAGVQVATMV
jgi:hypothetical protein